MRSQDGRETVVPYYSAGATASAWYGGIWFDAK